MTPLEQLVAYMNETLKDEGDPLLHWWARKGNIAYHVLAPIARELLEVYMTCRFRASLKHKDDGQNKFIKLNSQRQDIIIKYWISIGSIHIEQG